MTEPSDGSHQGAPVLEPVSILIEHATVVPVDEGRTIITDGAVAVRGNHIVAVGKTPDLQSRFTASHRIDGTDKLVLPGLIDGHKHLCEVARGLIPDTLITRDWLKDWCYPYLGRLTPEQEYEHALLLMAEMIRSGTTTAVDPGVLHLDSTIDAMERGGMRIVTGRWTWDHLGPDAEKCFPTFLKTDTDEALRRTEDALQRYQGRADGRIRIFATLEGVGTCSDELMIQAQSLADRYNTFTLMHKATSREEVSIEMSRFGHRPVEHMNVIGCLRSNTYLNHMTAVDNDEVQMLAEHDTKVCENPSAALKLAKGITQMGKHVEMVRAGVTVCLGCDGTNSSDFADMVRAMHLAATLPRDAHIDPTVITKEHVIEMATIDGAKCVGWQDEIGSLEPGKRADITIFDMHRPEWIPTFDPLASLIYSATGDSAHTVIVDGHIVMANRELCTIDLERQMAIVQDMRKQILDQTGLQVQRNWTVI